MSLLYNRWDKVVKIEFVRTSEYYDLSVPNYENYLAQGLIHHNSQAGKTTFGPHWLDREIRTCGPGDYLIGTSTFPLLDRKLLPEFLYVFQDLFHYGTYNDNKKVFTFFNKKTVRNKTDYILFPDSDVETKVFIGSAQNPESMESATVKGVWLDECVAPEALISTEYGEFTIKEIVERKLRLRVWSYDTVNNDWQLKPIVRWIKLPQGKPLLKLGNLRLTGNHKVWTKEGYILADELITSTQYDILRAEVIKDDKDKRVSSFRGNQTEDEGGVQESPARQGRQSIRQYEKALSGASRTQTGNRRTGEAEICQSSQSSVGTDWRRYVGSHRKSPPTSIKTNQGTEDVVTRREWSSEELETRETSGCIGVGERVCSNHREWLATSCLQDRCGGARIENSDRSRESCQSSQAGMVCSQWVDISSLLKSDGRSVDGGSSPDGFVYNLEVEGNHNYIADNILVSNCGQKMFKRETWEAVQRRGLINKARILFTTTLYTLGWLKTEIYDPGIKGDPDIDIIQFDSIENPAFPLDEYQRMKRIMPDWKFDMFHRGRFTKPAGLIYDAFDSVNDVIEPFELNRNWPRYVGHDFGPVNTVALWKAYDPVSSTIYTYREYSMGQRSTFEHVTDWIELSKGERIASRMGGSPTEDGWRGDFTQAGWRIDKPLDGNVWSQINRVYGFEKLHKHKVFRTCQNYLSEKQSFSRELDQNYVPIENKIEDEHIFHFMAAERYEMTQFRPLSVFSDNEDRAPVATIKG